MELTIEINVEINMEIITEIVTEEPEDSARARHEQHIREDRNR
jgi:hypothetical protein